MEHATTPEHIEKYFQEHPEILKLLEDESMRKLLVLLSGEDIKRIEYILENPWIDVQKALKVSDSIMKISPEISGDDLLNVLCQDITELTNAQCATCRTYDPIKNVMVASGSYNWGGERTGEIPYEQ